jgi:hypothetical protein
VRNRLHEVTNAELCDRIALHVFELNLLMRLAATCGIVVDIETVERDAYTELLAVSASAKP